MTQESQIQIIVPQRIRFLFSGCIFWPSIGKSPIPSFGSSGTSFRLYTDQLWLFHYFLPFLSIAWNVALQRMSTSLSVAHHIISFLHLQTSGPPWFSLKNKKHRFPNSGKTSEKMTVSTATLFGEQQLRIVPCHFIFAWRTLCFYASYPSAGPNEIRTSSRVVCGPTSSKTWCKSHNQTASTKQKRIGLATDPRRLDIGRGGSSRMLRQPQARIWQAMTQKFNATNQSEKNDEFLGGWFSFCLVQSCSYFNQKHGWTSKETTILYLTSYIERR